MSAQAPLDPKSTRPPARPPRPAPSNQDPEPKGIAIWIVVLVSAAIVASVLVALLGVLVVEYLLLAKPPSQVPAPPSVDRPPVLKPPLPAEPASKATVPEPLPVEAPVPSSRDTALASSWLTESEVGETVRVECPSTTPVEMPAASQQAAEPRPLVPEEHLASHEPFREMDVDDLELPAETAVRGSGAFAAQVRNTQPAELGKLRVDDVTQCDLRLLDNAPGDGGEGLPAARVRDLNDARFWDVQTGYEPEIVALVNTFQLGRVHQIAQSYEDTRDRTDQRLHWCESMQQFLVNLREQGRLHYRSYLERPGRMIELAVTDGFVE